MPGLTGRELWLYALYEEGGAEFDAAARFDPGGEDGGMAELLAGLMASDDCVSAVVEPLAARVAKHFER